MLTPPMFLRDKPQPKVKTDIYEVNMHTTEQFRVNFTPSGFSLSKTDLVDACDLPVTCRLIVALNSLELLNQHMHEQQGGRKHVMKAYIWTFSVSRNKATC